jgi:hypothetical protein
MGDLGKFTQDLTQVLKTELGRSTGAVGQLGQTNLAALHGYLSEI